MTQAVGLNCDCCGAHYRRVALEPGQWARCVRCNETLETAGIFHAQAWLASVLAGLITFLLANGFAVATLSFQGSAQSTTFLGAVAATWHAGYGLVAILTALVGFVLPMILLLLLLLLLAPVALGRLPGYFDAALKVLGWVRPWCMVPVFLVGALVSIVKLIDLASLVVGVGLYATAASAVFFTVFSRLSPRKIRLMALDAGLPVRMPGPPSAPSPACLPKAWAVLLAAAILYLPANALPVMSIQAINGNSSHTILGGVIELVRFGSWEIAAVVFIASVFVPIFKILLLAVLLWQTQRRMAAGLRRRTRLFRLVETIGPWSMLDVFVVILLVALAQFGNILSIEPGGGAVAFGAVVVLTMVAAHTFDPRLAWRWAGHRSRARLAGGHA